MGGGGCRHSRRGTTEGWKALGWSKLGSAVRQSESQPVPQVHPHIRGAMECRWLSTGQACACQGSPHVSRQAGKTATAEGTGRCGGTAVASGSNPSQPPSPERHPKPPLGPSAPCTAACCGCGWVWWWGREGATLGEGAGAKPGVVRCKKILAPSTSHPPHLHEALRGVGQVVTDHQLAGADVDAFLSHCAKVGVEGRGGGCVGGWGEVEAGETHAVRHR